MRLKQILSMKSGILPIGAYLLGCLVLWNWSMYVWLPFFAVLCILGPLMALGLGPVVYLSLKRGSRFSLGLTLAGLLLLTPLGLGLAFSARPYAEQLARHEADAFVSQLEVNLSQQEEWLQLEDGIGDIGLPRHVLTVYKFSEPRQVVEAKLRRQLTPEAGWNDYDVLDSTTFVCKQLAPDADQAINPGNQLQIVDEETLFIQLFYELPYACAVAPVEEP